jgi:hypothetical protein
MKLNKTQRYALLQFLCQDLNIDISFCGFIEFDEFCDGDITEWRVVHRYGMAGKIWNNGRIYISGFSSGEIGKKQYKKQQEEIEEFNKSLETIISNWAD